MLPDAITLRGEIISLFVAALVLVAAVGPVAALTGVRRSVVGDLFWAAAAAFVVVGHLAYLALAAPPSLLDPFVLIRVQSGVEPLAGAAAAAAVWWWFGRDRRDARAALATALAAGVLLATIAYDGACVIRDACYGAAAPAPLGFPMAGLAETRMATPLVEAAVLLALLAALLRAWPALGATARAAWLVAGLALVRASLTPLSVAGRDAVDARAVLTIAVAVAALAVALWRGRAPLAATHDVGAGR